MQGIDPDPHPWRAALFGTLLTIAIGMAYTLVVMPAIKGWHDKWWVVPEVWPPMSAARYVANGAYPYVYEADRFFVATPLGAVVLSPVAAVGQTLHLTDNYLFEVPRPTLWLVLGPYGLGLSLLLLYAARTLAHRVWPRPRPRDVERPPHLLWTQAAMFALVLFPAAVVFGHFEDVLALALVLLSIRSLLDDRSVRAAALLGIGIAFKQWAVLGLPVIVALSPPALRRRSLGAGLVVPGVAVAIPLVADWSHASEALFRSRSFTQLGHAALWVHHSATPLVGTPFRLGALVTALVVAVLVRDRRRPPEILASLALVFLARLVFEPVVFAYYLCPPLALLFLREQARGRTGLRTVVLGCAWMAFFLLHPNPVVWWAVSAALAAGLAVPAVAELLPRSTAREEQTVAARPLVDASAS